MLYLKRFLTTTATTTTNSLNNRISTHLIDTYNREHNYLRVSLTEKCNLRCTYCMPEEGVKLTQNNNLLTSDEIIRLIKLFSKLGVDKVRFTGGEPLVRKDCLDIISQVNKIDTIKTIAMTTNGILLNKKLNDLKENGLNLLNISLDTLIEKKFEFITKRKGWSRVMDGIRLALELDYKPLKINCVVMKGLNDDEICDFIELTRDQNIDVRFIEYMPFDGNKWNSNKMVSYRELLVKIASKYDMNNIIKLNDDKNDTSKSFKIIDYKGKFGFITSMSDHFCSTCNRIRLTADGNLKVCLFGNSEVNLRDLIRDNNINDDYLHEIIGAAVKRKKAQHAGMNVLAHMKNRPMILIGG
jgi:molybdenum cofactor biosynthesis protein A